MTIMARRASLVMVAGLMFLGACPRSFQQTGLVPQATPTPMYHPTPGPEGVDKLRSRVLVGMPSIVRSRAPTIDDADAPALELEVPRWHGHGSMSTSVTDGELALDLAFLWDYGAHGGATKLSDEHPKLQRSVYGGGLGLAATHRARDALHLGASASAMLYVVPLLRSGLDDLDLEWVLSAGVDATWVTRRFAIFGTLEYKDQLVVLARTSDEEDPGLVAMDDPVVRTTSVLARLGVEVPLSDHVAFQVYAFQPVHTTHVRQGISVGASLIVYWSVGGPPPPPANPSPEPAETPPAGPGMMPAPVGTPPAGPGVMPAPVGTPPVGPGVMPAPVGTPPAGPGVMPAPAGTPPVGPGVMPAPAGDAPEDDPGGSS